MLKSIRQILTRNLLNIPGWRTSRKIVVLESDDWGSVRMPSKEVYDKFLFYGIRVDKDPYCRYDSLATSEDLEALFEVLTSVKDMNGRHALLTANTVIANPDFEQIRGSGFSHYFYEPFTETLKRSPITADSFEIWKQGMQSGIFHPQFHGREHLNVKKWIQRLQSDDYMTRLAFDLGTFGLTPAVDARIRDRYTGAFNSGLNKDIEYYNLILKEGLNLFEDVFGYRSLSFIPTTYTWSPKIEPELLANGVRFLQGMAHQKIPLDDDTTFNYKKNNFTGFRSTAGLVYITRNAYFEPAQNPGFDWVGDCLNRVEISFRWHKPAVISMHRLNVIGAIDVNNRKVNLRLLKSLLGKLTKRWPDIEFMSSDKLGNLISNNIES